MYSKSIELSGSGKGENGMKLTMSGIKKCELWENAGIKLPAYDVEKACKKAKESPVWAHFGIGNIFRIFIGGIADEMCIRDRINAIPWSGNRKTIPFAYR